MEICLNLEAIVRPVGIIAPLLEGLYRSEVRLEHSRRYGRGSRKAVGKYPQKILGLVLEIGGFAPKLLRYFLVYSGDFGQLSLGDPLPYFLPCLGHAFDRYPKCDSPT